jgi:hypothetical protein
VGQLSADRLAHVTPRLPRPLTLVGITLIAVAIVIAHRVDAFTMPQFYAEDGAQWFSSAYVIGPIRALGLSLDGYLQVVSRLGPVIAAPFGIINQPLIFNLCGLLIQVAPVVFFLGSRFDAVVPSMRVRIALSAVYLILPFSELNVDITSAPFHLAILATLVIVAPESRRWYWRGFDVATVLLCGLSGPFVYILLPVTALCFLIRRQRFTLVLGAVLAVAFVVQFYASRSAPRPAESLGASLQNLVLIVSDRVILAGPFAEPGHRHVFLAGRPFGTLLAGVVCALAIPVVIFAARKAPWELKLFGLVAIGIAVAGLLSPLIDTRSGVWHIIATTTSASRYFFMACVAWMATLIWAASRLPRAWMTRTAWAAMALAFASGFPVWGYTPLVNYHWPQEARTIQAAAPGTKLVLPIPPGRGWAIRITAK